MRCALTVSLPRRPAIRVEHRAESFDLAFKMAFDALERQIGRHSDRARQDKRHPKKYYAARQATGPGHSPRKARRS
jgi:ribosome-associated translation inhibitor RaiA